MKQEAWLLNPTQLWDQEKYFGLICYGTDHALKAHVFQRVIGSNPHHSITEKAFIQNPHIFGQPDLFSSLDPSTRRLCVVIEDARDTHAAFYQQFFEEAHPNTPFLLLFGNTLRSTGQLVRLFTQHLNLIATPCYPPTLSQHTQLLQQAMKATRLPIPQAWAQTWAPHLPLEGLKDFIHKLHLLYESDQDQPTQNLPTSPEAFLSLIQHAPETLAGLAYLLSGRKQDELVQQLAQAPTDISTLLMEVRVCIYHFLALTQVTNLVRQGQAVDQAMAQLKPPIFFKHKADFKRHLNHWSLEQLGEALEKLANAELALKQTANPQIGLYLVLEILSDSPLHLSSSLSS